MHIVCNMRIFYNKKLIFAGQGLLFCRYSGFVWGIMAYHDDVEALGLIETVGMVPAIHGLDRMLKTASVELVAYENIGSTLVTVMVKGDVGAVREAVEAGAQAAGSIGNLTAYNVMPRPIRNVFDIISVHGIEEEAEQQTIPMALGFVETFGIVFMLEAADAMVKAADVELIGYENVASGYISALVQGDVDACQAAVDAGVKAVEAMDTSVYSSLVIATPHPDLKKIIKRYELDNLLP